MEEILYELRDHASGLNAGRWDYLFSIIKYFRDAGPDFVLVDRSDITMTAPFMRAYTELLVSTCHRRGAFAMGGMAAFIPSRRDAGGQRRRVRQGPRRQDARGRATGSTAPGSPTPTWCRSAARSSTACSGDKPNQLDRLRDDVQVTRRRSCSTSPQPRASNTEAGPAEQPVRRRRATPRSGCPATARSAIHNLMEDAATAEISRSQVWQQIAQPGAAGRHRRDGHPRSRAPGCSTRNPSGSRARSTATSFSQYYQPAKRADQRPVPERRLRRLPHPARVRAGDVSMAEPGLPEDFLAETRRHLAATDTFLAARLPR